MGPGSVAPVVLEAPVVSVFQEAPVVSVVESFAERCARTPHAVAVVHEGEELTFRELDRRASALATRLRGLGAGPEDVVAVCLPRGPDLPVALVAIWKAGGAYLPLDPDYPVDRLRHMVADARPVALVVDTAERAAVLLDGGPWRPSGTVRLAEEDVHAGRSPVERAEDFAAPCPDGLAYVIYTSGSTGRPKGVMVSHRSLAGYLDWKRGLLPLDGSDAVLLRTAVSFDPSMAELCLPLVTGARLVVPRQDAHLDPAHLAEVIDAERVTFVQFVPSLLRVFLDAMPRGACASLRWVVCSGEELPPALVDRVADELDVDLYNMYGPTEATINTTFALCPRGTSPVPIGLPVDDCVPRVLGEDLRPVPPGEVGELFLGGGAVTRGYLGRPGLTAERFLPDPDAPGGRLYRTGDLVRRRPDGALDYLGRVDHQFKVNGVRVEAGEIEAALRAHPGVAEAVVHLHEVGRGGPRLVAHVIRADGAGVPPVGADALRAHLAAALPAAVVPSLYAFTDRFALTPAGKVDRAALPLPEVSARAAEYAPPTTDLERLLVRAWESALEVERVGVHDRFLDLGGHSVPAMRIAAAVSRDLGTRLTMAELLTAGTVAELARELSSRAPGAGGDEQAPLPRDGRAPVLSHAQEQLWFVDQLGGSGGAYHVTLAMTVTGGLDVAALDRAATEVVRRHEVLRTAFRNEGGKPVPEVRPPSPVRAATRDVERSDVDGALAEEVARPFDLARPPLLRLLVLRVAEREHVVCLVLHHIVSDGLSLDVIAEELAVLCAGGSPPEPALRYADYAAWQRGRLAGAGLEAALRDRVAALAGAPLVLDLPSALVRPPVQDFRGDAVEFAVDAGLWAGLRGLASAERVTPFVVLLAAYQALLGRYTGRDDVLVGTPVAGRDGAGLDRLVGLFVNTVVLRADLSGEPGFRELLGRAQAGALEAFAHQDLPFELLVSALAPERDLARHPVVQALFVVENDPARHFAVPGLTATRLPVRAAGVKCDLRLSVVDDGGGLAATLQFDSDVVDRAWAEVFARQLLVLLRAVAADPDRPVGRVALDPPEDAPEDAASGAPAPEVDGDLWGRVARWVRAEPDRTAVTCDGDGVTYGGLDERVRAVADRLRAGGVGADALVAVLLPRGIDLVVALLAVWRAGAAFVPLDPDHPGGRHAAVLAGCRPVATLTDAGHADRLPPGAGAVLLVGDGGPAEAGAGDVAAHHPEALSHVVHTSGSTGAPKGIAATRRGVANYFADLEARGWAGPGDVVAALTTVSFDASLRDLLFPLTVGARVAVLPDGAHDLDRLVEVLAGEPVTAVLAVVPSVLRLVTRHLARRSVVLPALRAVLVSGEPLHAADVADLAAAAPGARLATMYGPTETTMTSTVHVVDDAAPGRHVPVGYPIAGTGVEVLDSRLEPAGVGVPGDVHISGAGLARGYLGNAALTAELFAPHPRIAGARLYRTGDRAVRLPDGNLLHLGRVDAQLKVNGVRADPSGIEAALTSHPAVARAAVALRGQLTGYVVVAPGHDVPAPVALRAHLADLLPHALVPTAFVVLDELPTTSSGKLDRRALPDPVLGERGSGRAPESAAERLLAEVWRDVLGVADLDADSNYFALGGDSVRGIEIVARAAAAGLRLAPRELFRHQTIAELALVAERAAPAGPQRRGTDAHPLSAAQQGVLFHVLGESGSGVYISQTQWLHDDLEPAAFTAVWHDLVRRHPVLRTRVEQRGTGEPLQVVVPDARPEVREVDGSAWPPDGIAGRLRALLEADRHEGFDVGRAPLLRLTLVRLRERAVAVLTSHHLLLDGWSILCLLEEFFDRYAARLAGRELPAPELPWRPGPAVEPSADEERFWRARLAGFRSPTGLPRSFAGAGRGNAQRERRLPAELGARLSRCARENRVTASTVAQAAWALLLSRYAGTPDVVFGGTASGRTAEPGTTRELGMFINTLPVRVRVPDGGDVGEWLREVQRDWAGIPSERTPLVRVHGWSELPRAVPLFDTILVVETYPASADVRRRLAPDVDWLSPAKTWTNYPFTLVVTPDEEIRLEAVFDRSVHDDAAVDRVLENFEAALDVITTEQ
ncbi:amino acid adenylation domain-containing protein [Actinosynnema pretiosum]|nr:amino acid adenylation domain-containing protein [Actinosynnema pretiosum]